MWKLLSTVPLLLVRAFTGHSSFQSGHFPDIHSWAAIGDSYAAGLGVGLREDFGCSRYSGGYPSLIQNDTRFAGAGGAASVNRTCQYLACSGLTSVQILKNQVTRLKPNQDLILLSAGGNDVQLGNVLDSCIFQWRYGGSSKCERALNNSQQLIDTALMPNLLNLLFATLEKLAANGTLYVTGYAQFFGPSPSCDNVTWSVWPNIPLDDRQYLTIDRRKRMNAMVAQVNRRIATAVRAINFADTTEFGPRKVLSEADSQPSAIRSGQGRERARFIDWDWTIGQVGGRFCEIGVTEPDPMRKELLFYEWNTLDDGDNPALVERPGDPVPRDTFEGNISNWVLETLDEHPDWPFRNPNGTEDEQLFLSPQFMRAQALRQEQWVLDHQDILQSVTSTDGDYNTTMGFDDLVFWFLPDSWKRVFHPRALGHRLIADIILHDMEMERSRALGMAPPTWPKHYGPPSPLMADRMHKESFNARVEL